MTRLELRDAIERSEICHLDEGAVHLICVHIGKVNRNVVTQMTMDLRRLGVKCVILRVECDPREAVATIRIPDAAA